jgi:cytochrome c peroxidase
LLLALAAGFGWRAAAAPAAAPRLEPLPQTVPSPKDNPATPEKIALGKQLFFDPRLSGNNEMSCATCHIPEKAFGDGAARAKGRDGKTLPRNTQTVLNVGHFARFFWDGRAQSLEEQALIPIQSADEMNQDLAELERELNAVPGYVRQFQRVFGTPVTRDGIARALAAFQRSLTTGPSPLDRYLAGDESALSPAAKKGKELFEGDAGCIRCHHGPLLSDGKLHRLGLPSRDEGAGAVTGKKEDRGKFRTPSLRHAAQTAPYMHDGSKKTLAEVVEFYYRGVPTAASDGLPLDVEPLLGQSFSEIPSIVAFLESLTGEAPPIEPPELP